MVLLGEERPVPTQVETNPNTYLQASMSLATPFSTSTLIRELFGKDAALMERLSWCESRNRQFLDGKVLTSSTLDYGYFQISHIWEGKAKELGLDFKGSVEDNIKMAKVVYDIQGADAWVCNSLI